MQHWMGKRALLAQGLEAIYSNSNKFILYYESLEHTFVASTDTSKPKLFCKAMQHPDANLWYKAAVKEMQVLQSRALANTNHLAMKPRCRLKVAASVDNHICWVSAVPSDQEAKLRKGRPS
jgi:hypothetical protein